LFYSASAAAFVFARDIVASTAAAGSVSSLAAQSAAAATSSAGASTSSAGASTSSAAVNQQQPKKKA
jgi:hypothetical protein